MELLCKNKLNGTTTLENIFLGTMQCFVVAKYKKKNEKKTQNIYQFGSHSYVAPTSTNYERTFRTKHPMKTDIYRRWA